MMRLNPISKCVLVSFALIALQFSSCAGTASKEGPQLDMSRQSLTKLAKNRATSGAVDEAAIRSKLDRFKRILQSRGKRLTPADWRLHDELLQYYSVLKRQPMVGTKITLPPHSHLRAKFPTFCLNSGLAAPSEGESYEWIRADPGIPYFSKILERVSNKQIDQSTAQSLLWSLNNETLWENYPDSQKNILKSIDSNVALKMPSEVKDSIKGSLFDLLKAQVPIAQDIEDKINLVKGEYYNYSDYAKSIASVTSAYHSKETGVIQVVPGTQVYTEHVSNGFSTQQITFYNPSDKVQEVELAEYFLQPGRPDVQRIGVTTPQTQSTLLADLESVLYGDMARLGIGFIPFVNDVADLYELLTGKGFLDEEDLSGTDRLLSGIGLLAGSGAGYRYAKRMALSPEKYVPEFEKGFFYVARKDLDLKSLNRLEVAGSLERSRVAAENVRKSPTLNRLYSKSEFTKTDFYVRPNGEVIPSRGYRYVPANAPYVGELKLTGKIPANPRGTYLSFDKFENASVARTRLQLPSRNGPEVRVDFDTRQILDDITVPRGAWGKADYLEPLTKDFPQFGVGGATQAITSKTLQAARVVDLRNGKVIYEAK